MSKMPEYDATAGFPQVHVEAFQRVACRNKMAISSRELNPLCTDLVLEGYAAKGFHIKAKTCDWGPMAGFVPEDYRFTKGSQNTATQKKEIENAFNHHAQCVPLFLSEARLKKLEERGLLTVTARKGHVCEVTASPDGGAMYKFTLVRLTAIPPGGDSTMWAVYYGAQQSEEACNARNIMAGDFPRWPGLRPVYGMTNPESPATLGVKAAVAGDYDLWCIFPHSTLGGSGVADRLMPLKATLTTPAGQGATMQKLLRQFPDPATPTAHQPGSFVRQQAASAGLIFANRQELIDTANAKEDKHLGNISHTVMKIRQELNNECHSPAGNVVQHSDYGGNPFGTIDYPLIFFVPDPKAAFSHANAAVAQDLAGLKVILRDLEKKDYVLKLNPAWSLPLY